MLGWSLAQSRLAKDNLLLNRPGHELHCPGVGGGRGVHAAEILTHVFFGGGSKADSEFAQAVAEDFVEFLCAEVLEDERVVKLVDAGFGELLRHIAVGRFQLGQNQGAFAAPVNRMWERAC